MVLQAGHIVRGRADVSVGAWDARVIPMASWAVSNGVVLCVRATRVRVGINNLVLR